MMKPQDIIVAVKLLVVNGRKTTYAELANSLRISASEIHGAVNRLKESHILDSFTGLIRKNSFEEFVLHGIHYVFPVSPGNPARGVLTGVASPFLKDDFELGNSAELYVWPYSSGNNRGITIKPLYKSVPEICMRDTTLYYWFSIIEMFRINNARERTVAMNHLQKLLKEIT